MTDQWSPKLDDMDMRIARFLSDAGPNALADREAILQGLVELGLDRLPLPGQGATLRRWKALETVARCDLALVKLYESHVDALAILQEIDRGSPVRRDTLYAVWASESRERPITIRRRTVSGSDPSHVLVDGRKDWCSGARIVDLALMTATDVDGKRFLVEVSPSARGVSIDETPWNAVGMRGSQSFSVACESVPARVVGRAGDYLDRRGFWHGGAGVAACWYGAAAAVGARVRDLQVGREDVHALAHLGAIDAQLASGAALLREAAEWIDAYPVADAMRVSLRVRGAVADLSEIVLQHAMRAVGPGPLCNEAAFAQRIADLPIFVRQSRGEHDQVAQARRLLADPEEMRAVGWHL